MRYIYAINALLFSGCAVFYAIAQPPTSHWLVAVLTALLAVENLRGLWRDRV